MVSRPTRFARRGRRSGRSSVRSGGSNGIRYGGVWLGTRSGSCGSSQPCSLFRAPIERSSLLFDFALGGGAVVGAPQAYGARGAVMCGLRFGYRSPPFLDGSGLALELALNNGFHGGFTGDPQATAAPDQQGRLLLHMGGDVRLYFRARARLQPYLQLGLAYTVLSGGEEETPALTGAGVIAGGGLLYWLHPHFALDLGLRYDGARLDRSRTVQALSLGLGIKFFL